jgi:uncharacterized protein YabN with tetrapyrrole methylase and pyrophosphatase domain
VAEAESAGHLIDDAGGSLTVVGTGIQFASHLTPAAREAIRSADVVLALVADPITEALVRDVNPSTRSLHGLYAAGQDRQRAYDAMTEEILGEVRAGKRVCAAFYGHPGVFVEPSHRAVERAREEGFEAHLLPAVSAEDCLFADLGVDPADDGCLSYEATDFLARRREIVTTAGLVLWQIGTVGNAAASARAEVPGLPLLVGRLLEHYPPEHEVVVYQASPYRSFAPVVRSVRLGELAPEHVTAMATLYVPPLERAAVDAETVERLGL